MELQTYPAFVPAASIMIIAGARLALARRGNGWIKSSAARGQW